MSRKTLFIRSSIIAAFAMLVLAIIPSNGFANADGTSTAIAKSKLEGIYQCYQNGGLMPQVSSKDYNFYGWSALSTGIGYATILDSATTTKTVACGTLLSEFSGKFPGTDATASTLTPFMQSMGYTAVEDGGKQCATYKFANGSKTTYVDMCSTVNSNGTIADEKMEISYRGNSDTSGIAEAVEFEVKNKKITLDCNTDWPHKGGCKSHDFVVGSTDFYDFANTLLSDIVDNFGDSTESTTSGWSVDGGIDKSSKGSLYSTYQLMSDPKAAGNKAISALSSYKDRAAIALTPEEQKALLSDDIKTYYGYQYYLGSESTACNLTGAALEEAKKSTVYFPLKISSTKTCFVAASKNTGSSVPTFNSSGYIDGSTMNFEQIVTKLNELSDVTTTTTPTTPGGPTGGGGGGGGELEIGTPGEPSTPAGGSDPTGSDLSGSDDSGVPECNEVAGVLGWFFCPVLNFAGNTVGNVYEWIEQSFLATPKAFMDRGSGTYTGWSTFRNFANILFAILFAIVILSQITGVGISNYNVKKMLPRLIIVVVLVNVSFILCQLAVDASNIVGSRINTLLRELAAQNFDLSKVGELTDALTTGATTGLTTVLGVGGLALGVATWRISLLPLFLTLVGALVSVIFFFIILGIRQAGIVILVTLAPLAIVCYALPNTKSMFDKWWKLFSALLMVYPICGAMMGGGTFAANLMLQNNTDGNFLYAILAMLLTIVPFFFVPSVLKTSLDGIGKIGTRLSTMGSKAGIGARKGIAHTEGFKDAEHQLRAGQANATAGRQRFARRIGGAISGSRAGRAVAGAAGAVSQWGDDHRILGAGVRGARAAGRAVGGAIAGASNRKLVKNSQLAEGNRRANENANTTAQSYTPGTAAFRRRQIREGLEGATVRAEAAGINIGNHASQQTQNAARDAIRNMLDHPDDLNAASDAYMYANELAKDEDGQEFLREVYNGIISQDNDIVSNPGHRSYQAFRDFTDNVLSNNIGALKTNDRGLRSLMQDVAEGVTTDNNGNVTNRPVRLANGRVDESHYNRQGFGAGGYRPEQLKNTNAGAIRRMSDSLLQESQGRNGATFNGDQRRNRIQAANLADQGLTSPGNAPKAESAAPLRRIAIAGHDNGGESTFGTLSAQTLNGIANDIRQGQLDYNDNTGNSGTYYHDAAVRMAQEALRNNAYSNQETADALNGILSAAGEQTIETRALNLGDAQDGADSGSIQVNRGDTTSRRTTQVTRAGAQLTEQTTPNGTRTAEVRSAGGDVIGGGTIRRSGLIVPEDTVRPQPRSSTRNNNGGQTL